MRKETKDAADAVAEGINALLAQGVRKKLHQAFEELELAFADHSIRDNVKRCDRCKLRVTGILDSSNCPNGCGPLRSVTWKQECLDAEALIDNMWRLGDKP